jgi:preprotein translocase subunit YajC
MSAVNLSAGSETFLGVLLVIFLGMIGVFFYLFTREQQKDLREQQRNNEKKQYPTGKSQ